MAGIMTGPITLGDLDMYTFTANKGDSINLRLGRRISLAIYNLYAPSGTLLDASGATLSKMI